jgi:hypothetical protein
MDERYTAVNFFKSSLATEDWPGDAYHMYRVTKRAFRIFFSLLYGARLTLDQILGCPASEYDRDHRINGEAFTITLLVCAYAELYGCLEWIGPRMMVILQSSPNFWEAVADKPREHLMRTRRGVERCFPPHGRPSKHDWELGRHRRDHGVRLSAAPGVVRPTIQNAGYQVS